HCNSLKAGLIRDINRLGKLSQIEEKLEAYKKVEGSYPDLSEGSYLPGVTISVWPSWTDNFRELLGLNTLVVDPVNSLGSCPGFEPGTCWNPQTKRFFDSQLTLPSGSYAMIYRALPGGVSYNLCATFETPALGYDTANALLTSRNCASKGGYQGGVINQPPSLISSFLKGEANKEFNGYLKVGDPEGDIVSWRLAPAGNFSSWSAIPILEATGDPSQKKVYASSAGNQGTYPMILTLTDGRGAISTTPINLEIFDILKIAIEAEGISYNSFQSGSLRYNFFINSSDPRVNFQLSSPNATLNTGLTQAVAGAKITNVTSNRKQISLEIPLAQYLSGQYEVRISASDSSGADAKTVTFDFIRDPLTFNFSCDNQARLGKGYQIGGTSCLLGPLSQGVRTINYQVANNPFGFVVRNSGGNAFLEAYRVTSGNVSNPNAPTTTLLTLRASDNFGESTEKKLALRINTYCGDGIKQQPNTEAAGGPQNNGIEQCDGLDGLAPQGQISNSSNQQYACTTPLGVNTPFPINSNEHCAFKAPQDGGGYCGDGFCQVSSGGILRENCSNCPKDCGACFEYCGNGHCGSSENNNSCPSDCLPVCGDSICSTSRENYSNCSIDCAPICGDGICAGETKYTCPGDCGAPSVCDASVTDDEGNTYKTVKIGEQCWMAENINIGSMLSSVYDLPNTTDNVIEKWCYGNNPANCDSGGGLYHWDEAMRGSQIPGARGICPAGWHIPTDEEINILEVYTLKKINSSVTQYPCDVFTIGSRCADNNGNVGGGEKGVGKSFKGVGIGTGVGVGDDLVGFNAKLPGYFHGEISSFIGYGDYLLLWSSTPILSSRAIYRYLDSEYSVSYRDSNYRLFGFSVRCLQD
ncbi:MAG: FISUMP domain-containing protein, partial [Bacteroidales bacterium]|nr:FISUMP domain-containing protein [Bacteroidales bacterium]